ncbi:acetyl-CoA synthetase-like protein [Ramaria rubella]|nr:acetyl-CoA synthetase-like protein [Ramaria rubella]
MSQWKQGQTLSVDVLSKGDFYQNPEEMAKAFVADPFHPGSTMYATRDLVRMNLVDGSLSFVDWQDTQIKIHGLRVETGEIEAVLKASRMTIRNAVVMKAISEIVVSLRHAIWQKLSSYMVPAIYVTLNRFPVAGTGKLDQKALKLYFHLHEQTIQASLTNGAGGSVNVDMSPWASTLCIREAPLCIDDDFYTVWGDSLSAICLASGACEAGLHLPATDIICNPTIRAIAKIAKSAVVNHEFDDDKVLSVTLDEMHPEELTVLTADQAHLDFLQPDSMVQDAYNVHQAWILPLGMHSDRLQDEFEDFIDHPNSMMFCMAELELLVAEFESGRAIQPFEQGEVAAGASIFELDGFARVLVWCMHHALFDGWAMDNVITDLHDVYDHHPLPL